MSKQPILENKIQLRHRKIGFPKVCAARLYDNRIEIITSNDEPVTYIPLTELQDVRNPHGCITFVYQDKYYNLEFFSIMGKIFGIWGRLIDGGMKKSRTWSQALQSLGIKVKKCWF